MAVTRPLKEGSVTTYQQKVAAGFPDILASEMDADLDTIYAAWNGGVNTANLVDGSVTYAKLAPDAQLWRDTGTTLTLGTNFVTRPVVVQSGTLAVQGTTGAVKTRVFTSAANANTYVSNNFDVNVTAQDDATKPSWVLNLGSTGADQFAVRRAPPGSTTLAFPLVLDASGNLGPLGNISTGGATGAYWGPGVRITGATAGIRCQSVGTMQSDGYSNAVAMGWDGSKIQARVDGTALGSVNLTPPSDERFKINVTEDIPGLAAVCALRPISFEYDQTMRDIGFPTGRLYGLIAQEARAHVPAAVEEDSSEEHWLALDYRVLVPVLIQAIKDLAARVDGLAVPR